MLGHDEARLAIVADDVFLADVGDDGHGGGGRKN
jgi:hypothetical protein